jgi:tRNA(fMet)-specific endonuclease VapC
MLSSISLFELWFGVANSSHKNSNEQQLADFCMAVEVLPFDDDDARSAAFIRADLMKIGKPIGGYDLLIAGQALRRGLRMVSADVTAFSRVPGLRWENWAT